MTLFPVSSRIDYVFQLSRDWLEGRPEKLATFFTLSHWNAREYKNVDIDMERTAIRSRDKDTVCNA